MERVTISMSDEFAAELADFMAANHYDNRSEAVRDLARMAVENDMTGNLPPLPAIFPDQRAPVVINAPPANTRP